MSVALSSSIPSIQELSPGTPRFQVPALDHPLWTEALDAEAAGGVDPDARAFLDAQLASGDVVIDANPGFGFVALSATTAPGGMPTVFVDGLDEARLEALQDAAADAGGWLESVALSAPDAAAIIDARLEPDARVFVHAATPALGTVVEQLRPLIEQGRVLAICLSDAAQPAAWPAALTTLRQVGFAPGILADRNGEMVLLPLTDEPQTGVIAVPADLLPTPAAATVATTAATAAVTTPAAPAVTTTYGLAADSPTVRDGFILQAPHARTGYGVAGAHLLRALQQRQVPVAYFPIGPVNATITDNAALAEALDRQGSYRVDVPSVRLWQQFDLAQHVGRGPRIGFTIFELDAFTPRERHHLRSQDALIVCSEWARQVCLDAGADTVPIHVVPLGVDRAVFHPQVMPARSTTDTVFLQVGKLEARKGQLELLRAFEAAFAPTDPVRLVLACANPFLAREQMDALLTPFRRSPMAHRISLMTSELPSQRDVAQLMASADCGVFASRAEGWNLEALEMLAMGRQVIATAYSAHTAYLDDQNARLIPVDGLEPAAGGMALGRWAAWGAQQHEALVAHLRSVHTARQADGRLLNVAGLTTAERFTWEHAADALIRAIDATR